MNATFGGMMLPLPTVFDHDGSIDEPLMRDFVDFYIDAGVDGLFVNGSYGQGPAMDARERRRVAELVIEQNQKRLPVIVHVGTADPYSTIALGRHALEKGADGVGVVGPYYYADHTPEEIQLYFQMVAGELKAPMLLYDNANYQGYAIGPAALAKLAKDCPNIVAGKLAKGTINEVIRYRNVMGPDFTIFAPSECLFPGLLMGQSGTISPPLAAIPQLGVELIAAIRRGDHDRAIELQRASNEFNAVSFEGWKRYGRGFFIIPLRDAGFDVKMYPRWPTPPVSDEMRDRVLAVLHRARRLVEAPARPMAVAGE
ncbi:MAG: dihydrodipicolinate synthase family protein [Hyphomicrobiales bacterium]|nr:dihydrodipicolinate synthase family protein [Hyphomicrobiales bacterium]